MDRLLGASLDWEGAVCVWMGWAAGPGRTQHCLSAHLGLGELPSVLQEHRTLNPYAWLLLRPTIPFPDRKAGSREAKHILVSTGQLPWSSDTAVIEVSHSDEGPMSFSLKA